MVSLTVDAERVPALKAEEITFFELQITDLTQSALTFFDWFCFSIDKVLIKVFKKGIFRVIFNESVLLEIGFAKHPIIIVHYFSECLC